MKKKTDESRGTWANKYNENVNRIYEVRTVFSDRCSGPSKQASADRKPLLYYSKLRNISTSPRHQNEPYKYERIKYYPRPYKEFCNE